MKILLKWLTMTLAIMLTAWIMPTVSVVSAWSALWLALCLGIINITIKPLLIVLTLPINILTLGLFTFVINALMILLASSIIKGVFVGGFWVALLFGLVLSIISYFLNKIFGLK